MSRIMRRVMALTLCLAAPAFAQTSFSGFTYQGELSQDGAPANGVYDLRFELQNLTTPSTNPLPICVDNVQVANGRFTVQLNFANVLNNTFSGGTITLRTSVRTDTGLACANTSGFTVLSPDQTITYTPYAAFSAVATQASSATNATNLNNQPASFYSNAANLTGTIADARLSTNVPRLNAANTYTAAITAPTFTGALNGNATSATNAANLNGQPGSFYLNAGNLNAGTLPVSRGGTNATSIGVAGTVAISNGSSLTYSNLGFPGFYLRYNGGGSTSFSGILASDLPLSEGDVTGTITATRVIGLQNQPIATTAPAAGQVLSFTSNAWRPASLPAPSVSSTSENVRIIRGTVFTSGVVSQGEGFTVTRPATGEYQITYSQPFTGPATVTATVFDTSVPQIATISQANSSTVTIRIWNIAGAAINSDFYFIAIGPR